MKPVADVLYELVLPLVDDKQGLSVKQLPSLDDHEVLCVVYAGHDDIGRLIGRQGSMAQAIRNVMMLGSRVLDKKIVVKFESY